MTNHFVSIRDEKEFDELIDRSQSLPVVLFKHSTTCPISAFAYREMEGFSNEVALVEVQRARDLSSKIESRTGVMHESPQVIVLRNGKVVWSASHWKVTAEAVAEAVRANG